MNRLVILIAAIVVLGAIAYALGHYMEEKGIRSQADSEIVAREKAEKHELETKSRVER